MLGDGPLRPAVQAEIERLGLGERIDLPGWVSTDDVLRAFRASDILFMPSLSEGLPVVGVQAAALGLALVVSRVGGWSDVVDEGRNGFMIDPQDVAGFAAVLRRLLSDPRALQVFRQESRALAAKFDMETIVAQYEQVLAEASRVA